MYNQGLYRIQSYSWSCSKQPWNRRLDRSYCLALKVAAIRWKWFDSVCSLRSCAIFAYPWMRMAWSPRNCIGRCISYLIVLNIVDLDAARRSQRNGTVSLYDRPCFEIADRELIFVIAIWIRCGCDVPHHRLTCSVETRIHMIETLDLVASRSDHLSRLSILFLRLFWRFLCSIAFDIVMEICRNNWPGNKSGTLYFSFDTREIIVIRKLE